MSNLKSIPGWSEMSGMELLQFSITHPNTNHPIRSADLQKWLRLNDLSMLDTDGKWIGTLASIANDPATPEQIRRRITGLLSQFREDPSAPIETDSDEYAGLLAWLLQHITLPTDEIAKFYELGQGRMYPLFESAEQAEEAKAAGIADDSETSHRQRARLAGARFGEQFAQGQDAGEVMAAIWGEIINGN